MFDRYEPDLPCPVCGAPTRDYQGKSGPCALFEFKQGHPPIRRDADGSPLMLSAHEAGLPDVFHFYGGECTRCRFSGIPGIGYAVQGVWTRSELDASGHTATRVHPECALCDECGHAIDIAAHMQGAYCRGCRRFVSVLGDPAA